MLQSKEEDKNDQFSKLQDKVHLLTDKNKRVFYEKFDKIFENQDFDGKEYKEIFMQYMKFHLYQIALSGIIWILFSFVVSRFQNSYLTFQQTIKIIVVFHFLLVYFFYSQEVDKKSVLDFLFPFLTIK